ncbi:MAG: glutamyl-tRNA reductase [Tepidisphaeraceae bacterium]|jgi:glutamyl-tRNA reductase
MSIIIVGLNHRTAPVQIREQLAFGREGVPTALLYFQKQFPGSEAAILSTCNRVEVIVASEDVKPTAADVIRFLAEARDLPANDFAPFLYQFNDEAACRHLFRVASGLDSMVLGEDQIVNQLKQAYATANQQGTTGRVLNRLFHHAFQVGKRARATTNISDGKRSVSSVAVNVAKCAMGDFSGKRTLVVGAGEAARLVCQHLACVAKSDQFVVMSHSLNNARVLAEACHAVAAPFDQFEAQLLLADVVVTAMNCPHPLLTAPRLRQVQQQRGGRQLIIIDLAVPRNVDPAAAEVEGVRLYDIDALGGIISEHQQHRAAAVAPCEKILDEEVAAFGEWLGEAKLSPLIAGMYRAARTVRDAELERMFHKCPDLTDTQKQAAEQLVDRMLGKFMHPYVVGLRHTPAPMMSAVADAWHEEADSD